jgi:molybdopterin-binding protein
MKLSARNQLSGATVEVDVGAQRIIPSLTVEAVRELGLREGAAVTAVVKASDVILATDG